MPSPKRSVQSQLGNVPAGKKGAVGSWRDPALAKAASAKAQEAKRQQDAKLQAAKARYLTLAGQTPLEFLTAVYRNQLYEDYEVEIIDEAKGIARVWPKLNPVTGELATQRIPVEIDRRIAAATAAAPYVHRKRPIGIDGGEGRPLTLIGAEQLAKLTDKELDKLLEIMGRMGIGAEFAGASNVIDMEGSK